jgi:hypothetical protein
LIFCTCSVATTFGQPIYHRMLRERFVLLQDIIELGFNFFFCDSDIAFASDFRAYIADYAKAENCDIIVQTDTSLDETWVETNGGFYFVQASNRTLQTFQMLQQFLFVNPEIEDQQALGKLLLSFNQGINFFILMFVIALVIIVVGWRRRRLYTPSNGMCHRSNRKISVSLFWWHSLAPAVCTEFSS